MVEPVTPVFKLNKEKASNFSNPALHGIPEDKELFLKRMGRKSGLEEASSETDKQSTPQGNGKPAQNKNSKLNDSELGNAFKGRR